ncbi:MAG: VWA domain-containing protein [Pararhodobacter sp.]|nr:VWA domain-containing protein [Pararhodobacter sp.]
MLKPFRTTLCAASLTLSLSAAAWAGGEHASVIVFDASGSMWAQLEDGKSRIEIAREVIDRFAAERNPEMPIGVVAYGHNRRGDCGDIETVLPIGQYDADTLAGTIRALNPRGMTPLTDSMALARQILPPTAESADIILITDGLENCGGDPCALAADFAAEGINLRAHVVGFALEEEAVQTLSCVPEQTGGQLFITQTGAELATAMAEMARVTEAAPLPQSVTVSAIDARDGNALGSAEWDVTTATGDGVYAGRTRGMIALELMPDDYIARVSAEGFADGRAEFTVPERDAQPVVIELEKVQATLFLRAEDAETGDTLEGVDWFALNVETEEAVEAHNSAGGYIPVYVEPGEYRIEGVRGEMTGAVSVSATLDEDPRLDVALAAPEPEAPEITLTAPSEVVAGARFEVVIEGAESDSDYLIIAETGADEEVSRYGRMSNRVGGDGTHGYTAPSAEGDYEIRYYLVEDHSLAVRHALSVLPADVVFEAPDEVATDSNVEISIGGGISGHVVIVDAGRAPDDIVSRYDRMRNSVDGDEGTITRRAPEVPGDYLLRYHASDDSRLLAELPLTVTGTLEQARLLAPETAPAGATIEVAWQGPGLRRDYVVVVEAGAPEGNRGHSRHARSGASDSPVSILLPDALGVHELRYVDGESGATLASREITLEPVTASVSAPAEIDASARFTVEWEGPVNRGDYVVIVEAGAPDGNRGHSRHARSGVSDDGSPVQLLAPDTLGRHEVRYVMGQSGRTLASHEVTLAPVGASVSAPEEIGASESFTVEWSGPVNRGDYIVIVEAGAPEGNRGHSRHARSGVSDDGSPVQITAPDALGLYEVRYVVGQSGRTLASQEVTLTPITASVEAPESVLPGANFEVHWQGPSSRGDYVVITEQGASQGDRGHSRHARSGVSGGSGSERLTAPDAEGEFEVRYVIGESGRTLAAQPVTVSRGGVTLEVDDPVAAGGVVEVVFTGPGRFEDLIEITAAGADAGDDAIQRARASQGSPAQLFAPTTAGDYEIRYRASDSGEVLATIPLVVE